MAKKEKDLRDLSTDELQQELNDTREELMKLRFQQATGELTDFTRLRHYPPPDRPADDVAE